ncbi:MAG: hypothetical protein KJ558_00775 [Gammaproteobacteria bacterium]|nr:hypothetical protein [Gammaproteobacteria bacterium]MBU1653369.1 hypothetical protein [Gammaproteobacteria bacterium]MBU1960524.1 hypothetical protein [Gammaproteobacteria bacterium]
MNQISEYFVQSELALAAYATLNSAEPNQSELIDAGMSATQASDFATRWRVIDQYDGKVEETYIDEFGQDQTFLNPTGLNATLFEEAGTHKQVVAIRGTEDINDLVTDVIDITVLGTSKYQGQYSALSSKVQQWLADGKLQSCFTVAGHSLGGFLATNLAIDYAGNVEHTYIYNAPGLTGIGGNVLLAIASVLSPDTQIAIPNTLPISNIVAPFDVVSFVGLYIAPPVVVEVESQSVAGAHSIAGVTDALAVYDLLAKVDTNLNIDDITGILKAASKESAHNLENIVAILVDTLNVNVEAYPNSAFYDHGQGRDKLYEAHGFISNELATRTGLSIDSFVTVDAEGNVNAKSPSELTALAHGDIAYRYALVNGNPFAVLGADYTRHNQNRELDLYDPVARTGNLTAAYLADRARYLSTWMDRNEEDVTSVVKGAMDERFLDLATGDKMHVTTSGEYPWYLPSMTVFGTASIGEVLTGENRDDRLYGMGGNDLLAGNGGADRLEGGEGIDVYLAGDDDILFDTDGKGYVFFSNELLSGGIHKPGDVAGLYHSADDLLTYQLNGETLTVSTISESLTINNFRSGDLGISLTDGHRSITGRVKHMDPDDGKYYWAQPGDAYIYGTNGVDVITADGIHLFSGIKIYGGGGNDNISANHIFYNSSPILIPPIGSQGANLYGETGNDILRGSVVEDWIEGGEGHDEICGVNGDDVLLGGSGNDMINGDDRYTSYPGVPVYGSDDLFGEDGIDLLLGGGGHDFLSGGSGDDILYGDASSGVSWNGDVPIIVRPFVEGQQIQRADFYESSVLESGDDVLNGSSGNDQIFGGAGNDILAGGSENDYLEGEAGDDTLFGGEGTDSLWGDKNPDTYAADYQQDTYPGGSTYQHRLHEDGAEVSGNDYLYGEGGSDYLNSGRGNDHLYGGAENDYLYGGDGDDFLSGDTGLDELYGGNGNDIYFMRPGEGKDYVGDTNGFHTFLFSGASKEDLHTYFIGDQVQVTCSDGVDGFAISKSQWSHARIALGSSDNIIEHKDIDTSYLNSNGDIILTVLGSSGLTETQFNEFFDIGMTTPDLLTIHLSSLVTQIDITAARDETGGINITIPLYFDALMRLPANHPNSSIVFEPAFSGMPIFFSGFSGDMQGTYLNDHIDGSFFDDQIMSYGGDDVIFGNDGNDYIRASEGSDRIEGGKGNDYLEGGTGNDQYDFSLGDGSDVIKDSSGSLLFGFDATISSSQILLEFTGDSDSWFTLHYGENDEVRSLGNTSAHWISGVSQDGNEIPLLQHSSLTDGFFFDTRWRDIFEGGNGNDTFTVEGWNNDVFAFGAGAGQDRIAVDSNYYPTVMGELCFGADVNPEGLSFTFLNGDAQIGYGNGDQLTLDLSSVYTYRDNALSRFTLASDIDPDWMPTIRQQDYGGLLYGSFGGDHIIGGSGIDTILPGYGDDVIEAGDEMDTIDLTDLYYDQGVNGIGHKHIAGQGDNDRIIAPLNQGLTFHFNRGDGNDSIAYDWNYTWDSPYDFVFDYEGNSISYNPHGQDTIWFGEDIALADLRFIRFGDSLQISLTDGSGSILVDNFFPAYDADVPSDSFDISAFGELPGQDFLFDPYVLNLLPKTPIELLKFADGATYDMYQVLGAYLEEIPDVTVLGTPGNNYLEGGGDDDVIVAFDGDDRIYDYGGTNRIDAGSGDDLIEVWSDNIVDGGPGDDSIDIYGGTSTIKFGPGSGDDYLYLDDLDTSSAILELGAGVELGDISVSVEQEDWGNYLVLTLTATGETLSMEGWRHDGDTDERYTDEAHAINEVHFSDGTVISGQMLYAKAQGISGGVFQGTGGNDSITGSQGDDLIIGGAGNELLDGSAGIDTASYEHATTGVNASLWFTTQQDTIGAGFDTLRNIENLKGSDHNDTLTGNGWANVLQGDFGNDTLSGGRGDDRLEGGAGDDLLLGGIGNDTLIGGKGRDTLTGGVGADTFVLNSLLDYDLITDFVAMADKIVLDNTLFSALTPTANGRLAAEDFNTKVCYDQASSSLSYDADADGNNAIVIAQLGEQYHVNLTANHFVLI